MKFLKGLLNGIAVVLEIAGLTLITFLLFLYISFDELLNRFKNRK